MHVTRVAPPGAETLMQQSSVPTGVPRGGRGEAGLWPLWLRGVLARLAERAQLRALDERELRDIGLTPAEAAWLARKPVWRP